MAVAGGRPFKILYYMVCFGAFAQFIFGVIQKTRQWGSDVIRNQEEDAGADLVLPDIYLCLPAWSAQVAFNGGGWTQYLEQGVKRWTTNGAMFHGNRFDNYNEGKRCQGYAPTYAGNGYSTKHPCVEVGYSHKSITDFDIKWDGTDGDSVYMVNNEAKWDYPDNYYENEAWTHVTVNTKRRKVFQAMLFADDKVYDGTYDFDAKTLKPKALPQDESALKLTKGRIWGPNAGSYKITERCFVFKNPLDDEGNPTRTQPRDDKHLWFSFKLNIGVTISSATTYMMGKMWFVKPGTDPSEGDRPPTVEVPLHNSNNQFELNVEKLVDRTSGADQTEQTVYHAELQSNTQKLYHEAPQKYAFNGQFAWTEFKFRMNPQAPVTTTTKRNRGYSDVAADLGGLWAFMFIIIGAFFVPTGLVDQNGDSIVIFAFMFGQRKLALLKQQALFEADGPVAKSDLELAQSQKA